MLEALEMISDSPRVTIIIASVAMNGGMSEIGDEQAVDQAHRRAHQDGQEQADAQRAGS